MNWKTTAALGVIAAGIGAYVYFVDAKQAAPTDTNEVVLWELKEDQEKAVSHVLLKDGASEARYERKQDKWAYAAKPDREMETWRWDSAYGGLKKLVAERKVEDRAENLSAYGLASPSFTIELGGKTPYTLAVGEKNPLGQSYYVQKGGDPAVYLLGSYKVEDWKKLVSEPPLVEPSPEPAKP